METIEYDHNLFTKPGAGDDSLFVLFYMSILQNAVKSAQEGRPIFDETVFVKIFAPGDRNNVIDRPATQEDKLRFASRYAQFQKNAEQWGAGTPLAEWPIISRSQAEELKYFGFQTVEQIATAKDDAAAKFPGFQQLKARAAAFLELAKSSTQPLEALQAKVEEKDSQILHLNESVEELRNELRSMRKLLSQQDKIAA